jgi:predicted secreted acid phosphatase
MTSSPRKDISSVVRRAKRDLKRALERRRPARPAVVLDVDDTSLSLYACLRKRDFDPAAVRGCEVAGGLPALRQPRSFFGLPLRRHVAVFFITGRREPLRESTVENLRRAGYRGRWKLVMRPADDSNASLVRRGYRILANLGDQRSDVRGGYARHAYRLPNPMYVTP